MGRMAFVRKTVPVYIGLLRAVNVGGANPVSMDDLRTLLTRMRLEGVQTLLQSGNVVFRTDEPAAASLEHRLEERIARDLRVRTDVFLRTTDEWSSIVRGNPFPEEAASAPGRLIVTTMKRAPSLEQWRALTAAIKGPERMTGVDRAAYIVYPDGTGRSRLTPDVIERHLATRGTSRNWNTVTKLADLSARL